MIIQSDNDYEEKIPYRLFVATSVVPCYFYETKSLHIWYFSLIVIIGLFFAHNLSSLPGDSFCSCEQVRPGQELPPPRPLAVTLSSAEQRGRSVSRQGRLAAAATRPRHGLAHAQQRRVRPLLHHVRALPVPHGGVRRGHAGQSARHLLHAGVQV